MTLEEMLKSIKPEQFSRVRRVAVRHPSFRRIVFMCPNIDEVAWRCGKCHRGILLEGHKFCRVCGAKASFERMIDWREVNAAYRHIQMQYWREQHPA